MAAQNIGLRIDEHLDFFCPACGTQLVSTAGVADQPCSHVLFFWLNEVGEFEKATPLVRSIVKELGPEIETGDILPWNDEFLEKFPDSAILFSIAGATTTLVVGIDFPE